MHLEYGQDTSRLGFTLVEVLVTIAIIGVLLGLLLPAVQSVRESARTAQCKNNLRQVALGCLSHEHSQGFFPNVGINYNFTGDPDLGFGSSQGGSWLYNILPFIEQTNLHQLGAGLANKSASQTQRVGTAVSTFNCPTRGSGLVMKGNGTPGQGPWGANPFARTDYSGNREGLMLGMVREQTVLDGLTNVILCGERNLDPDRYRWVGHHTGPAAGRYDSNEQGWTTGGDHENLCRGSPHSCLNFHRPIQDTPGVASNQGCGWPAGYPHGIAYGSPHAAGFHVATGGGSIRTIN